MAYGMMGGQGMMGPGAYLFMGYGWLFQLLILILLVAIFWWLLRGSAPRETAQDVVKRRYAAGEITKKEYERLLKDIEG